MVVILIGLWASHDRNSLEPIIAYIIAIAISILNDIILLGLYFSDAQDTADRKYSCLGHPKLLFGFPFNAFINKCC